MGINGDFMGLMNINGDSWGFILMGINHIPPFYGINGDFKWGFYCHGHEYRLGYPKTVTKATFFTFV